MKTETITITPDDAREMLKRNKLNNRPTSSALINQFADDMKRGKWRLNGESIVLAKTNELLDGQHRLSACVTAGVPFDTVIVTGVDADAFDTLNIGKRRTVADVLAIDGEKNEHVLATALNFIKRYELAQEGTIKDPSKRKLLLPTEALDVLHANRHVRISMKFVTGLKSTGASNLIAPGTLVGFHALLLKLGVDDLRADAFITAVYTGLNLNSKRPEFELRQVLIRNARAPRKYPRTAIMILLIQTWNHTVNKDTASGEIRWRKGQTIPKIKVPAATKPTNGND